MMASRILVTGISKKYELTSFIKFKSYNFSSANGNEVHFVAGTNLFDKSQRTLKITDSTIKVRLIILN